MRVLDADVATTSTRRSVVAIGVFDGVHRGHQVVVEQVVSVARQNGADAIVVTFDPTPAEVLAPQKAPKLLASLDDRLAALEALGVDEVRVVSFSEAASQEEAGEFVRRVIVENCQAMAVIVGEDFHFGRTRGGNVTSLSTWGVEFGFSVLPVSMQGEGERFSSTRTRSLVSSGDIAGANAILGHPFGYTNVEVVHGDARGGAELGYPTANIDPSPRLIRPALGIYAGYADLPNGERKAAAISVGKRPQFYENGELLVEAFLLDFSGDLYSQSISLYFLDFLRGEMKFDSVEALVGQMALDVQSAGERFASYHY
jgi:riboflavin kinase/FMN adenylyltransferase